MAGMTSNTTDFTWDSTITTEILSISGPSVSISTIDVSTMNQGTAGPTPSAGAKQFIKGIADYGEITFEIAFDIDDNASHLALTADMLLPQTVKTWKIEWPDGTDYTEGSGFITAFSPTGSLDDKMTASITIRTTSVIVWPS